MKLALILLGVIGLSAILGTLIPQQDAAREAFLHRHPMAGVLFQKAGLFDLYRSAWFIALEGLLILNLIACTWRRFPHWWRRFRGEADPAPEFPAGRSTTRNGSLEENAALIEGLLKDRYGKSGLGGQGTGSRTFVVRRNAFSCLGVPVIHFGVLVIMAGALAGTWLGFEGEVMIPQGESAGVIRLKDGSEKDLGFKVRCDRFKADFYSSGAPREFRSDLSFLKGEEVVKKAVIRVNEPAEYDGIRFYQSTYGNIPETFVIGIRDKGGREREVRIKRGGSFALPEAKAQATILRAEENLMGFGPGIKLSIESGGRDTEFWVFKNIDELVRENPGLLERAPLLDPGRFKPYRFTLRDIQSIPYTGLMVSRDPAVPLVFAGFIIVVAGCIAIYLFPAFAIRISADRKDGRVRIGVSGRCGRNKAESDRELDAVLNLMKTERTRE